MIRLTASTPEEILAERARRLSHAVAIAHEPLRTAELLCFRIAGWRYALDTSFTFSVVKRTLPAAVPGVPEHIIGILGVQGEIVPLVDLARLWGSVSASAEFAPAVVLGTAAPEFAIVVDGFDEMTSRPQTELEETRPLEGRRDFVDRVMGDGLALLDAKALLDDPRFSIQPPEERGT